MELLITRGVHKLQKSINRLFTTTKNTVFTIDHFCSICSSSIKLYVQNPNGTEVYARDCKLLLHIFALLGTVFRHIEHQALSQGGRKRGLGVGGDVEPGALRKTELDYFSH